MQNLRNDFTLRLIKKHIQPGMRVLDVGCGNGEITFLLAEAVGNHGIVDGVDINENAIENAKKRAAEFKAENTDFYVSDISAIRNRQYDAIFGRRILMYQNNPIATLKILKKLLKPDGIMLFQESDEKGSLLNGPEFTLHNKVQSWIWQTVQYEGGDIHIGSKLYEMMHVIDMQVSEYCAEAVLQTSETGSDLAWVTSMMAKRMKAAGIHLDSDHLEERLNKEMNNAHHAFIRDLAFGICAKKDG